MILRAVAAKSLGSDLEFSGTVAEAQEAENAEQQSDSLGGDGLHSSDINGLRIVAQPVAKVDAGNHNLVKFLASNALGHSQRE